MSNEFINSSSNPTNTSSVIATYGRLLGKPYKKLLKGDHNEAIRILAAAYAAQGYRLEAVDSRDVPGMTAYRVHLANK